MRLIASLGLSILLLAGCTTTPQADGSTRVKVSLGEALGLKPKEAAQPPQTSSPAVGKEGTNGAPSGGAGQVPAAVPQRAPGLKTTRLANIFRDHPYDGTPKTFFPRVAVTVTDWSRSDCWQAVATIWWSKTKSEAVPAFSVCWGQSLGFAVNNAANFRLFMEQMAVEHSGNVRTTGPKPPMLAIPDRQPIGERQQVAFQGFIQQLALDTGWQSGAPTNLWLVGYDAHALAVVPAELEAAPAPGTVQIADGDKPMDRRAKQALEQALTCASAGKSFEAAEAALTRRGWNRDNAAPVRLAQPLKVFGFNVETVEVFRGDCEQRYSSHLPGVSVQEVIKAASLKRGKDGSTYGRLATLGVLTVTTEHGETTLSCSVVQGADC